MEKFNRRAPRLRRSLVFFAIFAALAFCPAVIQAAMTTGDLNTFVQKLQQHYQATESFTAKFTETITSPGAPPRTRQGTVAYRKPGLIRWEFAAPQPETIVSDGKTLYDYDPGLNQVVEMPLQSAFKNRSALAFILGAGNLERDFNIARGTLATDDLTHIVMTPKDGGNKIELGIDKDTMSIVSFRVTDGLGNSTLVKLSDIQWNVLIELAQFKFVPPSGADIVAPTGQQ